MSRSILSQGFQVQPPSGVSLDLENPFLINVKRLWSTHEGRLKEYIVQRSTNIDLIERNRLGISGNFAVNNATNLFGTENPCLSGDITVFAVVELIPNTTNQSILGRNFTGMSITADTSQFAIGMNTSNAAIFAVRDVGVGSVSCTSSVYTLGSFYYTVLIGRVRGTTVSLFVNGVEVSTNTLTVGLATSTVTQQYHIGNNPNANGNFNGYGSLFGVLDRACSNAEILDFSKNPWKIFKPLRTSLYIASSGRIGSMTAVEPTVDTLSAVGTVLIQGSLSAVEPTKDTFSSSGKVIVQGVGTIIESGVDVFSGVGSTTGGRTGSMAAIEPTKDVLSSSGTILIQGTASIIEPTSDTFYGTNVVSLAKCVNSKWTVQTGSNGGTLQVQMASEVGGVDVTLKEGLFFLKYRKI